MEPDRIAHIGTAARFDVELLAALSDPSITSIIGADPVLASPWLLGEVASVALARVGLEVRRLAATSGLSAGMVGVEVTEAAASLLSFATNRLDGRLQRRSNDGNPLVAPYRCADGRWFHLHGGFPKLADGLRTILELGDGPVDADRVADAVAMWPSDALEHRVAEQQLCGAVIRTSEEWLAHPHGAIVYELPLVCSSARGAGVFRSRSAERPLSGLRVLDLTRVLAGPACGRTLAAFGADVVQVRAPNAAHVPAFELDTGFGKRRWAADLEDRSGRAAVVDLALGADVIVQGYRPGAMDRFGLDEPALRERGWGGVYGSLSCYGPVGPWRERAGWEQLAQSVSGLTVGSDGRPLTDPTDCPSLLPAAANDYITGYVLAGELVAAVNDGTLRVDASLCQTAAWIVRVGADLDPESAPGLDLRERRTIESVFGTIEYGAAQPRVDGIRTGWDLAPQEWAEGPIGWSDSVDQWATSGHATP